MNCNFYYKNYSVVIQLRSFPRLLTNLKTIKANEIYSQFCTLGRLNWCWRSQNPGVHGSVCCNLSLTEAVIIIIIIIY